MPGIVLANRAAFKLASSISPTALTFSVQPGTGSRCPEISGGKFAYVTFKDASGNYEVMRVTGHVAGSDVFTMSSTADRGLDGTTARSWLANDAVRMGLPRIALWDIMNGATTDLGIAGGTENALAVTADPPGFYGYRNGNTFKIIPSATNTGAATLSIGGRTARPIFDGDSAIAAGDLRAGFAALLYDDGTRYQLLNPAARAKRSHTHSVSDVTGLSAVLDGLLVDPVVTGNGITLPSNATDDLHAVPLQQLRAEITALKSARRGTLGWTTGSVIPTGSFSPQGQLLLRADYTDMWAWIQASGLLVTEAEWAGGRIGCYTAGTSALNFRVPLVNGVVIRAHHNGSSAYETDTTRAEGSYQPDELKSHSHFLKSRSQSGTVNIEVPSDSQGAYSEAGLSTTETGGLETRMRNINYKPFIWW